MRQVGTWLEPGMGLFCQLLAGELDAFVGFGGGPWDFAPTVVVVAEAGGSFHDLAGGRSVHRRAGLLTNGVLDDELLRHFSRG